MMEAASRRFGFGGVVSTFIAFDAQTDVCVFRVELLELEQLKQLPPLLSPQLRRFGIGTHLRRDAKGTRLSTVIMLEGVPCH